MRRLGRGVGIAAALFVVLLVGCTAAGAGASRAAGDVSGAAPARMLVYAQEWSLWPSRASLPAGSVTVQLSNRGQDAHDLRIRRLRRGRMTGRTQSLAVTRSGAIREATWSLRRGTYELYCSLPGHLHRGMRVRLVVR
jgi:hypothetical protein